MEEVQRIISQSTLPIDLPADHVRIGNVLDKDPFQLHNTLPFVLRPDRRGLVVVHTTE